LLKSTFGQFSICPAKLVEKVYEGLEIKLSAGLRYFIAKIYNAFR
jgi:hypothetical protein